MIKVEKQAPNMAIFSQRAIARALSIVLGPAVVSVLLVVLVALYQHKDLPAALGYAGLTLCFLSGGPLGYILLGVRLGKLSDLDVSQRAERTGPMLFGLCSALLGLGVLLSLHAPKNLETILIITIVSDLLLLVITWWWKISVHAAALAGALTLLTALYGAAMLPAFVLLGFVSWSRVVLGRHTPAQVIVGSCASIVVTLSILLFHRF